MLSWFANLKIAHKLALGFGLVLLLMSSTLAVDVLASAQQSAVVAHLVYHLYPARYSAREIVTLVRAADADSARYIITRDKLQATRLLYIYYQDIQQLRETVSKANVLADSREQQQALNQFSTFYFGHHGYYDGNEAVFTLKRAGKVQAAYDSYVNVPSTPSLAVATVYINAVGREIAQETAQEAAANRLIFILSLTLGAFTTVLGTGIAILIARSIIRPLAQVQRVTQQVSRIDVANLAKGLNALAHGDLTVVIPAGSVPPLYQSHDEIGQTAQAMRTIIAGVHSTVEGYEIARHELQQVYGEIAEKNQALTSANVRLASLATTDPLTGLSNHRAVMVRIEEELARCRRTQIVCAILFIDIDHFKHINDTWGHLAGDVVLQEAGRRLTTAVRQEDFVGRYGGEEFAIVLTNIDLGTAKETAERVRTTLGAMPCVWQAEGAESIISIPVTVSIGVAIYREHGSTRESLIEAADTAMYSAKHTGRNRVCLAGEELALVHNMLATTPRVEGGTLQVLSLVASMHDRETSAHALRMVQYVQATAQQLDRSDEEVHLIGLGALLHDIGKIGIPDAILHKLGPLTEEEWTIMRRHPHIGRQILKQAGAQFELLSHVVLAHHERWDGGGYPYGLAQEMIPLGARILTVVDSYDAITSDRPYRDALPAAYARAELERGAGSQFDPQVVDAFLQVLDEQELQTGYRQMEAPHLLASPSTDGVTLLM
ncbi:MAG: diguanylate cyclase [Ktedonobacteraceae bacterium]|nr:diguanylate cyclase [Ktedonobacteraceae bacterium]